MMISFLNQTTSRSVDSKKIDALDKVEVYAP